MNTASDTFGPHLALSQLVLRPGAEWRWQHRGWGVVLIGAGIAYSLRPESPQELEPGAVLLVGNETQGTVRASHLNEVALHTFSIVPARLAGLLTVGEQAFFEAAGSSRERSFRLIQPRHPVAVKMRQLCSPGTANSLLSRLRLLQLFIEAFEDQLEPPGALGAASSAKERLRDFLRTTPSSELLEMSFQDLAQRTRCTPRHLSRMFHEVVGMSFRDKHSELRLAKARELLATSNAKIVDVALESGYRSLSLFNLMFSRRFGSSPSKWRAKHGVGIHRAAPKAQNRLVRAPVRLAEHAP